MSLKALIFDVDGTLADTEEAHRIAFNTAFAEVGLDWHWSRPQYAGLLLTTGGKERIAAHLHAQPLSAADRTALDGRIDEIHARKTRHYTRMIRGGVVPLREGVQRLLQEARAAGVALAIASTTTPAAVEALLEVHLGRSALGQFAVVGAGDCVARKKPAPDIYRWVLRELGAAAGDCAALEDSAIGLAAAKGAGLFTVVTPSYWTRTEDFRGADLVLPSLDGTAPPAGGAGGTELGPGMLTLREIGRRLEARRHHTRGERIHGDTREDHHRIHHRGPAPLPRGDR